MDDALVIAKLRAILDGAEYRNIDKALDSMTVEECRQLGEAAAQITKDLTSMIDNINPLAKFYC